MTEEERKMFAGELKEHILLPSKQEVLDNDLNSVEQILVDNKYQVTFNIQLIYFNYCTTYVFHYRSNILQLTNMEMYIPC